MIYEIYEGNFSAVAKKVARINAKLTKVGAAPVTYKVVGRTTRPHPSMPNAVLPYVTVDVDAATSTTNGWTFLGTIARLPEGAIIRTVPGRSVPSIYRNGVSGCDHCKCNRVRRDTYVIGHDDGRTMQIGSDCLQEIIGVSANGVAKAADLAMAAGDVLESAQRSDWLGGSSELRTLRIDTDTFLTHVAAITLGQKRFVTRKAAGTAPSAQSTSDMAYEQMRSIKCHYPVTDEAIKLAETARAFVLNKLTASIVNSSASDDDFESMLIAFGGASHNLSEFEHSLFVCASAEAIEPRFCGVAAYIVEYYRKHQNSYNNEASKLSGDGLVRIFDMLNKAKETLKNPSIRLQNDAGVHLQVSLAKAASRNAGSIYVKSAGFGGDYYGKISPDGNFFPTQGCPDTVKALLVEFANNPEDVATRYGRLTGRCCFCNRGLADERSTKVGFGPVCAAKFDVAWGVKEPAVMNLIPA